MATLLTLKEFLAQNRISRATFYRLPSRPQDPDPSRGCRRLAAADGGGQAMILKSVDHVTKSGFNTNFVTGIGRAPTSRFLPDARLS